MAEDTQALNVMVTQRSHKMEELMEGGTIEEAFRFCLPPIGQGQKDWMVKRKRCGNKMDMRDS